MSRNNSKPKNEGKNKSSKQSSEKIQRITLDALSELKLADIPGMSALNYYIVVVFEGNTAKVGMIENLPKLKPIMDLKKLSQARRVALGEESLENKEENVIKTRVALNRMMAINRTPVINDNFKTEIASYSAKLSILEKNEVNLAANQCTDAQSLSCRAVLTDAARRIRIAMDTYLLNLTQEIRPQFAELVKAQGVCSWILKKMTLGPLNLNVTSSVARVFFPAKQTGSISLSIGELREPPIIKQINLLLVNSGFLKGLAWNDAALQALGGATNTDPSNSDWRRILDFKIFLNPIIPWRDYASSFVGFPLMNFQGGRDAVLERVCRASNAIYALDPVSNRLAEFLAIYDIREGIDRDSVLKPRQQVMNLIQPTADISAFANNVLKIAQMVNLMTALTEGQSAAIARVDTAVVINLGLVQDDPRVGDRNPYPRWLLPITEQDRLIVTSDTANGIVKSIALPKVKSGRQNNAISSLTKYSRNVVSNAKEHPKFQKMCSAIESYLRGFESDDFQNAAAKIINAVIDSKIEIGSKEEFGYKDPDNDHDSDSD